MKRCRIIADIRISVNPFGKGHGGPQDSDRHVGDLGNIKTDAQGNAKGSMTDSQVKLIGEQSVLGVSRTFKICYPTTRQSLICVGLV